MQDQFIQLVNYIRQAVAAGANVGTLYQNLQGAGWPPDQLNEAFRQAGVQFGPSVPAAPVGPPKSPVPGILWIASPFIILVGNAILQLLLHLMGLDGVILLRILSLLVGMAGVILLFVGPIVGIIKLTHR